MGVNSGILKLIIDKIIRELLTYGHMCSWFSWIIFGFCVYTAHSNAAIDFQKEQVKLFHILEQWHNEELKASKDIRLLNPPVESIINEQFKARSITMTECILCSGMIFYSIFGTNSMYDPPEKYKKPHFSHKY